MGKASDRGSPQAGRWSKNGTSRSHHDVSAADVRHVRMLSVGAEVQVRFSGARDAELLRCEVLACGSEAQKAARITANVKG